MGLSRKIRRPFGLGSREREISKKTPRQQGEDHTVLSSSFLTLPFTVVYLRSGRGCEGFGVPECRRSSRSTVGSPKPRPLRDLQAESDHRGQAIWDSISKSAMEPAHLLFGNFDKILGQFISGLLYFRGVLYRRLFPVHAYIPERFTHGTRRPIPTYQKK